MTQRKIKYRHIIVYIYSIYKGFKSSWEEEKKGAAAPLFYKFPPSEGLLLHAQYSIL